MQLLRQYANQGSEAVFSKVEINQGNVSINGCPMPEPYLTRPCSLKVNAGKIPDGKIALVGDNREIPHITMVLIVTATESVVGKVISKMYSR